MTTKKLQRQRMLAKRTELQIRLRKAYRCSDTWATREKKEIKRLKRLGIFSIENINAFDSKYILELDFR